MWNKNNIQQELQEISQLVAGITSTNVYRVHPSYFDGLPASILQKIQAEPAFSFNKIDNLPYGAPAGYFDGLAENILSKIRVSDTGMNEIEQELMEVAPALSRINRSMPYNVPAGFFDSIQIPAAEKTVAKVVSMYSVKKVMRYAVAAVVIALMVIAGFLFFDKTPTLTGAGEINVIAAVDKLSDEEIIEYLADHSTAADAGLIALPGIDSDIDEEIKELSDEELQYFLQQHAEPTTNGSNGI